MPNNQSNTSKGATTKGKSSKREPKSNHTPATIACAYCRNKKIHCDERRPTCGNCGPRGLLCAYEENIRRRGKAKAKEQPSGGASATPDVEEEDDDAE